MNIKMNSYKYISYIHLYSKHHYFNILNNNISYYLYNCNKMPLDLVQQ